MSGVTSGDNRPRCVRGRQSYAQVPSTRSVVIHCINSRVALYDNRNAYPFACFTILKIRPNGANKCDLTQIPANREKEFFILDKVATRSGVRVRRHRVPQYFTSVLIEMTGPRADAGPAGQPYRATPTIPCHLAG